MDITPAAVRVVQRLMGHDVTMGTLSRRSGIPARTLHRLMHGQRMTLEQAQALAGALGVSLSELITEAESR